MNEETKQTGFTFHLVTREYYESERARHDYYVTPQMEDGREEFIHCTDGTQNLADTGNRFYSDNPKEFLALVIDKNLVKAPIKYEDPNHIFPHIYGVLNYDAVVKVLEMLRDKQDRFLPPE